MFQIKISFKINSKYYLLTKWLHDKEIQENKIKPQTLRKIGMIKPQTLRKFGMIYLILYFIYIYIL